MFRKGYLSQVVGLKLMNATRVVVKARAWQERLRACEAVQQSLVAAGFPAPRLLVPASRHGDLAVSAEAFMAGGELLPPRPDSAQLFAEALLWLIERAPDVSALPPLEPSLPWVAWEHNDDRLWPDPDDSCGDLNTHLSDLWLDDIASAARGMLLALREPVKVGHGDWYSQNITWAARSLHAVHDWDSVVAQPEPAIVGAAAAIWPGTGSPGEVATLQQSEDFLEAYQRAGALSWSEQQTRAAWAAGLWTRAFDAKKASIEGKDPELILTRSEARARSTRAGL